MALALISLAQSGSMQDDCAAKLDEVNCICNRQLPCMLEVLGEGIEYAEGVTAMGGSNITDNNVHALKELHTSCTSLYSSLLKLLGVLSPARSSGMNLKDLLVSHNEVVELCRVCITQGGAVHSATEKLKPSVYNASPTRRISGPNGTKEIATISTTASYLISIKSAIFNLFLGPQGVEKTSFPMMRSQIRFNLPLPNSRVRSLRIPGPHGNVIDGIYLYAQPAAVCTEPTVLFCPPNAGFYECFAMAPLKSSWLGFYMQRLGMNVCVFNYRGYGDSSGVPDPSRIKADGLAVAEYLKEALNVKYLYLHGESIGGMVACHIARRCESSALVCDRTFVCLEAVARRMLGDWAGVGLRMFQWDTDVLDDYLHTDCCKIVIQDPGDEIIFHPASLEVGIAFRVLFGDSSCGSIPVLSREYRVANALGLPVSISNRRRHVHQYVESILSQHRSRNTLVLEEGRHKVDVAGDNYFRSHAKDPVYANELNDDTVLCCTGGQLLSEDFVEHFAACCMHFFQHASPEAHRSVSHDLVEEGISNDDGVSPDSFAPVQSCSHQESSRKHVYSSTQTQPKNEDVQPCVTMNSNNNWTEVWEVIARVDGCCGQSLGEAVVKGLDGIRAWVACFIIWGARRVPLYTCFPSVGITVQESIRDINRLLYEIEDSRKQPGFTLQSVSSLNECMVFISKAFEVILIRQQQIASGYIRVPQINGMSDLSTAKAKGAERDTGLSIGHVIPVHCGHNGWPHDTELNILLHYLEEVKAINSEKGFEESRVCA
eukprot:CAMPEP_0185041582 /NCGR_PEP_ID=MMETSP1103-20130426/41078_1 /TAXON_ID=36769 /ORGANISM="Paraphysomonas bandaiensis, Strain Caron Lab Isolate" /LENGTH=770 /DNA_ID=CAMNT_0027581383 /DNA_START=370 /DNA_END=2682 /DNA_ORIENTATION=+